VASIGLGPLSVSPLDMAAAYATFASGGIYARPTGITKVVLPNGKTDSTGGWGKPDTKRALSEGVAWKVTQVLAQNALYGTGAGSGDGRHPNAGKTGTTEDHADAWFVGYTRDLSTAIWMGYPRGEIPMLSVHGQEVAGATFPVPMWHLYMTVAEQRNPVRQFLTPKAMPVFRPFQRGNWGYASSYYTTTYTQTTTPPTTAATTTAAATSPASTTPATNPSSPAPPPAAPAPAPKSKPPPAPAPKTAPPPAAPAPAPTPVTTAPAAPPPAPPPTPPSPAPTTTEQTAQ
jgi:membrane peptidoglycan carboxypeptidase